jgi:hypothetical protein
VNRITREEFNYFKNRYWKGYEKCPICNGEGISKLQKYEDDDHGLGSTRLLECELCNGIGLVEIIE